MRLVIKGGLNSRAAFVVFVATPRGKKHAASIIFSRKNAASIRGRLLFKKIR